MNPNGTLYPLIDKIQSRALYVGLGAGALSLLLGIFFRGDFDRAYVFSYLFVLGLALGSLALLMVHRQLGGAWGFLIRRPLEAGAMTLPLMLLLFIPILVDLDRIYPWASGRDWMHEEASHHSASKDPKHEESPVKDSHAKVATTEPLKADPAGKIVERVENEDAWFKLAWLNPKAFTFRLAIYFAIWIGLAMVLGIGSKRQDETGSLDVAYGLNGLSAPGLVAYFLTVSFALIDWGMSLEPKWYSSLYGVLLIIGQGISTMAFMILVASFIARRGETEGLDKPETFNDLGNLLLAFTMLWGYLSFSQFLIIWAGNLAEEIPWYMRRLHGGWEWIGRFLIVFHFAVPFLILLCRPIKRNAYKFKLWMVAALVFFAHLIDDFWLIGASSAFDLRDESGKILAGYDRESVSVHVARPADAGRDRRGLAGGVPLDSQVTSVDDLARPATPSRPQASFGRPLRCCTTRLPFRPTPRANVAATSCATWRSGRFCIS